MKSLRGVPRLYHVKYKDRHGVKRETTTWYADVWSYGKRTRVALGSDKTAAIKRLKEILAASTKGFVGGKVTILDLERWVLDDYKLNGRKTERMIPTRFANLRRLLGDKRDAASIGAADSKRYAVQRSEEGVSNGTIGLELSALIRGMRLAHEFGKLVAVPYLPKPKLSNARKGFFEPHEFDAIVAQLPDYLRAFAWTCRLTGWRSISEVLTRQWQHVDFGDSGWLRLEPHETKNGEGRNFPLIPQLRSILEWQRDRCDGAERLLGRIIPWVFFHNDGSRIQSYSRAWTGACERAGLSHRLVHDFRRTAVRDLEDAGVARSTAKKMVGHRTDAIYQRYAIRTAKDLEVAGDQLREFHEKAKGKVVPMRKREGGEG